MEDGEEEEPELDGHADARRVHVAADFSARSEPKRWKNVAGSESWNGAPSNRAYSTTG